MFSGIVEKTAAIIGLADGPGFRRLTLAANWDDLQLGQSIAINGCCLTVAELSHGEMGFDVIKETLEKTNLGLLQPGDFVNLERSVRLGDRLEGHVVQGHIDGRASLINTSSGRDESRFTLEAPFELAKYIVPKGSVALDGVSLTVAAVDASVFEIALIPTTLRVTTFGRKAIGWQFNLETDVLSKTIVSWLERRPENR